MSKEAINVAAQCFDGGLGEVVDVVIADHGIEGEV